MGEPVVRTAIPQSMKLLGRQFILGQTIQDGLKNSRELEEDGYTYSYDMLGEAARTGHSTMQPLPTLEDRLAPGFEWRR